jgi:hypothetical protein
MDNERHDLYRSPNIVSVNKSKMIRLGMWREWDRRNTDHSAPHYVTFSIPLSPRPF